MNEEKEKPENTVSLELIPTAYLSYSPKRNIQVRIASFAASTPDSKPGFGTSNINPVLQQRGESREAEKPLFRCRALFDKRRNQRSLEPGNAVSQKKERGGRSPWGLGRVTEEPKNRFLL